MTTKSIIEELRKPPIGNATSSWGDMEYTDWIDESMSWKTTCYVGDWSWLPDLLLKGPDAQKLLSNISVNSFVRFPAGKSKHIIQCNDDGKIITQGVCMRTGQDEFHLFWTPAWWTEYKLRVGGYDAKSKYVNTTNYQVSGPNALFVLEKLCGESVLRDVPFTYFRTIHIKGHDVIALRIGMAGEVGFELQAPAEHAKEIYDAILEAGQEWGIRRMGGRVGMTNHLEAFYPTTGYEYLPAMYGEDMQDFREYLETYEAYQWFGKGLRIAGSFESNDVSAYYRDPVELGWSDRINFDHEFIGRKALEKIVAHPTRTSVTLVWNPDDVLDVFASLLRKIDIYDFMDLPRSQKWQMRADKVLKGGKLVGVATSRGLSVYFREMLSLCVIDLEYAVPGTEVTVIWGSPGGLQKEIRATVGRVPYKKDNSRIDLHTLPSYLK
jgi:vanillate/3-O-methylgallate O-demethylase